MTRTRNFVNNNKGKKTTFSVFHSFNEWVQICRYFIDTVYDNQRTDIGKKKKKKRPTCTKSNFFNFYDL